MAVCGGGGAGKFIVRIHASIMRLASSMVRSSGLLGMWQPPLPPPKSGTLALVENAANGLAPCGKYASPAIDDGDAAVEANADEAPEPPPLPLAASTDRAMVDDTTNAECCKSKWARRFESAKTS